MIELKPDIYNKFNCPECCYSNIKIKGFIFQGIHILADCECNNCKLKFYADFPVGHGLLFPVYIAIENGKMYQKNNSDWFSKPLHKSYLNKNFSDIKIEKKVYKECKKVILLNCLDYLYGHVLLKLFNADYYLKNFKDLGIIIIIPKSFEWIIPKGVSEVWLIDIKLSQAQNWFVKFDEFVHSELKRFDAIYLSLTFSHPDFSELDISRFCEVNRFDMSQFLKKPVNITFITREDRLWVNKAFSFFVTRNRFRKLAKLFRIPFIYHQNKLVCKTFRLIKKLLPDVNFNVVGLGKTGRLDSFINDYRKNDMDRTVELEWCNVYAQSQIVLGIHGSNMILPTALAGSFIEILPENRLGNIIQDIGLSVKKRDLLYLGRFVDEYATPYEVANIVVSLIKAYPYFYLNMNDVFLEHNSYNDVTKWETSLNNLLSDVSAIEDSY